MAFMDPRESFAQFRDKVLEGISSQFPIKGSTHTVHVKDLFVQKELDPHDIRSQYESKTTGGTWAVPVMGTVQVVNNATGKVVSEKKLRVSELPMITSRHSYIIDGQEYQVPNQWQLKPGVYVRRNDKNAVEAQFTVANSAAFKLKFDPKDKIFQFKFNDSHIPAYSVLRALGVSDEDMKKSWGQDVLDANRNARGTQNAVERLYKTVKGSAPASKQEALTFLSQMFNRSKVTPDVVKRTLGRATDTVDPDLLFRTTDKIFRVYNGEEEDDRDSLLYKKLRGAGDFAFDKIQKSGRDLQMKVKRQLATGSVDPRQLVPLEVFRKPVRDMFRSGNVVIATQINPLEMLSSATQTTITGPGGIQSDAQITSSAKMINKSQLSFLDPSVTPEGCFIPETEVLTSRGWLPWPEVTKETRLACLVDGRLEFHVPLALVAAPYRGDIYELDTNKTNEKQNKTLRYAVTPNHRVWSRPLESEGYRIDRADEMHAHKRVFQVGHAPCLEDSVRYDENFKKLLKAMDALEGGYEHLFRKYIYPEARFQQSIEERQQSLNSLPEIGKTSDGDLLFTTVVPELALDAELLALSLGQAVQVHRYSRPRPVWFYEEESGRTEDVYEVYIFRDTECSVLDEQAYSTRKYDGQVYCAEVPGGLVYVRLGDSIGHWSGNSKTGVSLRLPIGVTKVGDTPHVPVYNLRTHKTEHVDPTTFYEKKVVLPDQIKWENGKPKPISSKVQVAGKDNEIEEMPFRDADYAMHHPSQLFNITANMVPFLGSNSGGRVGMAARHMEQTVSLLHREPPLVQSETGAGEDHSFEKLVGSLSSHTSPVAGHVVAVKNDGIHVKDASGKVHEVQLYNHFPLNDAKSFLHSTALVKEGDKVQAGQVVADTNYTKNGQMALGTNLRVGYMSIGGLNYEDGIVISKSAANKLSSVHLHKPNMLVTNATVLNKQKFRNNLAGIYTKDQFEKLGDDGVVKVGQRVSSGDPLIAAMRPFEAKDKYNLAAIRKSLMGQHTDGSLVWDSDHEGEVVGVHKKGNEIVVHVKTVEPMQVGDKMCFDEQTEVLTRRGWKNVAQVSLEDEVCCLVNGEIVYQEPTGVHYYPQGGRMYRIKSQQVDLLVTENHNMYVRERGAADYRLVPATQVAGKRVRYSKTGVWRGEKQETFVFPALEVKAGQGGKGVRTLPVLEMPCSTYLMLLGAFLSEGNIINQPASGTYGIEITQVIPKGRSVLEAALQKAGVAYTLSDSKYRIHSKQLLEYFKQFGHSADKYIPDHVFSLPVEQLQVLFHWLMWGDGSAAKDGRPIAYSTVSKKLADDVQRLCLHLGLAANVKKTKEAGLQAIKGKTYWCQARYDVRIVSTKLYPEVNHGHVHKQAVQEEGFIDQYDRPVYCVTVPGHVLYVRRNGKAVWSGNSGRHGNKGVVTAIFDDDKMPKTKKGEPIEVALNFCYDKETEFLTKRGWVLGKDLVQDDFFASVNRQTLQLEYQQPIDELYRRHYTGKMYKLQDVGLDFLVTPNHRMYVSKHFGTEPRPEDFQLEEAQNIFGYSRGYLKYQGDNLVWYFSDRSDVDRVEEYVEYNDFIYCATVPNHTLIVRRNGKAVVSGNTGVPGRMNLGQVYETVLGKVAKKTGKPFIVSGFNAERDNVQFVKDTLKKHGLEDTEELVDPTTGKSIGKVLVGYQNLNKLVHQVEKKSNARSGMTLPDMMKGESYDLNLQPTTGGGQGGQSFGSLGVFSLLAHGAVHNLRDAQAYKSEGPDPEQNPSKKWPSQHFDVWNAIQSNGPLPTPKPTFAFEKFQSYLKGAGVNIEKKGNDLVLTPLTDKQILHMSQGREIKNPTQIVYERGIQPGMDPKPVPGGLFDDKITGGHSGRLWSHIKLAEPVPNPVFEKPIQKILGLTGNQYEDLVLGKKAVSPTGKIVPLGQGVTGGSAIKDLLSRVDVKKELQAATKQLDAASTTQVASTLSKVKYLRALDQLGMRPEEAYVLHHLPVIPPKMRPVGVMASGDLNIADMNKLYKNVGQVNNEFEGLKSAVTDSNPFLQKLRGQLYENVREVMGLGLSYQDLAKQKRPIGLLHQIAGASPKTSLVQDKLVERRQDLSFRTTVVPEPSLGFDQVGLPKHEALKAYMPFVVEKLKYLGYGKSTIEAQAEVKKQSPAVWKALEKVMQERPVLMKRDPALHKYSIQAFKGVLAPGNAIQLHPMMCEGLNADFDGDQQMGLVLVFLRGNACKYGLASGNKPFSDPTWWEHRKVPDAMAARFRDVLGYVAEGSFHLCNLEDFPYLPEEKISSGHIDFYKVPSGIEVVAYDETQDSFRLAPVSHWSVHKDRFIEIVNLRSGRQIVTDDDPRAVYGMDQTGEMVRRRPSEATGLMVPYVHGLESVCEDEQRQHLYLPTNRMSDSRMRESFELNEGSGRLLGSLVGDGWLVYSNGVLKGQIGITKLRDSLIYGYMHDLHEFFHEVPKLTFYERTGGDFGVDVQSKRYIISSTDFSRLLEPWIGHMARGKHLPPFFLHTPKSFRLGMLAGLMDTDGSISISHAKGKPQWMMNYSTTSIRLAQEIVLLARSLNVFSSITATKTPAGREAWVVSFSSPDMWALRGLPCNHDLKRNLFNEFFAGPSPVKKGSYSSRDVVPVPLDVAQTILKEIKQRLGSSLYVVFSKARKCGYVSRYSAQEVLERKPELKNLSDRMAKWALLVADTHVWWDQVQGYEKTEVQETGYDLTVPGYETFMAADGLILSNTMAGFVPVSKEAVQEAHRMLPSNNLFSDAHGRLMYTPSLEYSLGLYKLSKVGKETGHKFDNPFDALKALEANKIQHEDVVTVEGKKTTAGRLLLASALPPTLRTKVVTDFNFMLDKKGTKSLLETVARDHTSEFGTIANKLKDLGAGASSGLVVPPVYDPTTAVLAPNSKMTFSMPAHTLTLDDITPDYKTKQEVFKKADKEADKIRTSALSKAEKDRRIAQVYRDADDEMKKKHFGQKFDSNLRTMYDAGIKPQWNQYKQLVLAPGILVDSQNRAIPTPVRRSYAEGLTLGEYWTQMHGARRGAVLKVQEVQEPGYMSKLLVNSTMNMVVPTHDCGTTRGTLMSVSDGEIFDRHLAKDVKVGNQEYKAGTLVTPDLATQIKKHDKDAKLLVRTPLKCEHDHGVCQKCMGLSASGKHYDIGTNIGIQSSQAIGERAVQITLKEFHCLHGQSLVLVRRGKKVFHTTLEKVFEMSDPGHLNGDEEIRQVHKLEVWDKDGWTAIRNVRRHLQQPGTEMVYTRTRLGYGLLSQDNHPHMAAVNEAVCKSCRTWQKRMHNNQYECRKCRYKFPKSFSTKKDFEMVEPQEMSDKSHEGYISIGPAPSMMTPHDESGWFIGMFCAEGCIHAQKKKDGSSYIVGISIGQTRGVTEVNDRIADRLGHYQGKELQLYGVALGNRFSELYGRYSRSRGLPQGWSGYNTSWLMDFVAGVFDGDGTFVSSEDSQYLTCRIDTTSYLLAQQVHWILRAQGVDARILVTPWRVFSAHQGYAVTFGLTEKVAALLSASEKLKGKHPKPQSNEVRFGEVFDYIRPVRFGAPPYVYDLETETHTLMVGGVWTHNSGGVATGKSAAPALTPFQYFNNLVTLPKEVPNPTVLATASGKITKIENDNTGVRIFVNDKPHFVGKDAGGTPLHKPGHVYGPEAKPWQPPKVGMTVELGQPLSDPNRTFVNPHDLYATTKSIEKVQNHLVNEMHNLYKDEGVRKRHFEVLVKAMSSLTKVRNPGDHSTLLRGEFVPLTQVQRANQMLVAEGKKPVDHAPIIKGVRELPYALTNDWLAKMQHDHLRGTVTDAAALAGKSNIHGTHPIPGLVYGAEFGINKRTMPHKILPDHLAKLEEYDY